MILQALNQYYERLRKDPEVHVPEPGFAMQGVHFALHLAPDGELLQVHDLRERDGKNLIPKRMELPHLGKKRTSGIEPNFLWDNTSYVFGASSAKDNAKRLANCRDDFLALHRELAATAPSKAMDTLLGFLEAWGPEKAKGLDLWKEIADANIVFRLDGEQGYLHNREDLRKAWVEHWSTLDSKGHGYCLVTGTEGPVTSLHPGVKGVPGSQQAELSLVSFNKDAFESYGKEKSNNAPMCKQAAFAYTTALNRLLRREHGRKVQIGDAATIFWTERDSPAESFLGELMAPQREDQAEDTADARKLRDFLETVRRGERPYWVDEPDLRFFILGLAPNAARLSVRFWRVSTVGDILEKVGRHFRELSLVRQYDTQPEFPPQWMLVRETAAQRKLDNVPAPLAAAFMRAVLTGADYPASLMATLIMRIRADHDVSYLRAAMIKACLVRNHNREVSVSLDENRKDQGYLLGRLFAVLERAQEMAVPGANATIKDRFFGAASASPGRVFHVLLKNGEHHLAKLRKSEEKNERYWNFELTKLIQDIVGEIDHFKPALSQAEQGEFLIGYYHQRKKFFTKKDTAPETQTAETTAE